VKKYSLVKNIFHTKWLTDGILQGGTGDLYRATWADPMPSGSLEENFDGSISEAFFTKVSELLTKLPNLFEAQLFLIRASAPFGFRTRMVVLEQIPRMESYSHLDSLLRELQFEIKPVQLSDWQEMTSMFFGKTESMDVLPDILWDQEGLRIGKNRLRALSLTELPQVTWKACLQPIFEIKFPFCLSLKIKIPDRGRIKKQLETKRRVSHALSITSSLEVRNIESNSVLHSSEETLERILVAKETLFEISMGVLLLGDEAETLGAARDLERAMSGIGNAGIYLETLGTLPVFKSHLPGNKTLGLRTLPILSENLAHLFPLFHDYSRVNDQSSLMLQSRSGEVSHLNLFSKQNLNFNSFICGASGSGKSFLMNAILKSTLKDEPNSRLCIFDIGGSYRKIIESHGGKSTSLNYDEARALISTFLKSQPVQAKGFFRAFIETLCGSGSHITHSHLVAIEDLLKELEGQPLQIAHMIQTGQGSTERFYQDIAHWLKPYVEFDKIETRPYLLEMIKSQVSAFDFKELESNPVLQKSTILLLTELLWGDLVHGKYPRTVIVFDEVWRFFAQSKGFLEEMYRTLRKYKAGIVSITQNLADYGDDAFAKMLFTNSFTRIFLQNGATAEYLRDTFDLPKSDISRALSVTSKKPVYSEFFALSPNMSQVFRLYPTEEFYRLANTENIANH